MDNKKIKCEINGQQVEVPSGITIIEAFRYLDKDICHYCWHPGLSVAGVCRLCVVDIEGINKPQIACNTQIKEGMKITNQSESIKKTVEWGLNFHLINHPLDCPICDQSGECGLQDQYMQYGKYKPSMSKNKVKKRKVIDLGKRVVLDSERCILCSRCVRFTDEVTKTNELGIFKRGDQSEIGTYKDRPLNNDYAVNTVDICPVGALTSKDFRFHQRVWYLKVNETVCPGCSTGCNINVSYNEEGLYRVKPRFNKEVNNYWMCDKGRDVYKWVNATSRVENVLNMTSEGEKTLNISEGLKVIEDKVKKDPKKLALILNAQLTNEECDSILSYFTKDLNCTEIYYLNNKKENKEEFDGLLIRGDKNPNTFGLKEVLKKYNVGKDVSELKVDSFDTVVAVSPENLEAHPELDDLKTSLVKVKNLIWLSSQKTKFTQIENEILVFPLKTFFEKKGSFKNFEGRSQELKPGPLQVKGALDLNELTQVLSKEKGNLFWEEEILSHMKTNFFPHNKGVKL